MEQRRMHSQRLTHNAPHPQFDMLQSQFCPGFPEQGESESKVAQAPHSSPPYVQQPYSSDSGASPEVVGSPPLPYYIQGQPQGLSRPPQPSAPEQHQPRPPHGAHPHTLFQHGNERQNSLPPGIPYQLSRHHFHPPYVPMDQLPVETFSDDASPQPMHPRGSQYTLHLPMPYPPQTIHPPAPAHPPPEQSQPTTTQGRPTFRVPREDRALSDNGGRCRSWGAGAGSLDPSTGVFSRASDHPRIRTAQACDKCRARKAKCSGDHPCQRCHERGLECKYAAERRMRGPNKPKPSPTPLDGSPQPPAMEGQKIRRRASTLPSVPHQGMHMWEQQTRAHQPQHQEQGVVAAASPASSASSANSGSLGFHHPLSESEASPMTPHSLVDRHSASASFPTSPRILLQDSANMRPGVLSHISEVNSYGDDGAVFIKGMVSGVYGQESQDMFPRKSFDRT